MEKPTLTPWVWSTCSLPLRSQIGINNVIWSLKPTIALTHPKLDDVEPLVNLSIETEKSFQYSEDLGWNWHKSWNIPTVSLRFDITDPNTSEKLLCPGDFKAHMFAVKPFLGNDNNIILVDVGLQGSSQIDIVDGKAVFQGLKFASTSFNNEGVKFHLVMCLYLQITEDSKPKVLKTMVSPPIFVDSRRGIRENEKSTVKDNPIFGYAEPFFPDKFTKKFIKKDPKKKDAAHEDIQNSIEGLFSYLTAPNIRNKIKHPVFLNVRFSSCASLYYNSNKIAEQEMESLVENLQGLLHEDLTNKATPQEVDINESFFVMWLDTEAIEDKSKKKKLWELINPIRCRSLTVVALETEIPWYFIKLNDTKWMADLYSKSYPNIVASSKEFFNDDEFDDDESSADRMPPPEVQVVPCNPENNSSNDNQFKRYIEFSENFAPIKKVKDEHNSLPIPGKIEIDGLQSSSKVSDQRPKQTIENSRNSAQTNQLNVDQNPIIRTAPNVGHPLFFNHLPNHMAQFGRPVLDPNQIWLSNQNLANMNPAIQQQMSAYRNMGMNVSGFPVLGYGAGLPIQAGQIGGLNMQQQPMLNRDLNKLMADYAAAGMQLQGQQELYELKREGGTPSQSEYIKSEANVKEEDEL